MPLRRVPNAHVEELGLFFRRWRIHYSKTDAFDLTNRQYRRLLATYDRGQPAEVGRNGDRVLWWTADGFFWADPELDSEAVSLLLWNRQRRQDGQLERLRKLRARAEALPAANRERIPDEVRLVVWERDDGRCVRCGADEDLQFDHVIPVAKGGGTSVENIQVLCGDCNRAKSASIV